MEALEKGKRSKNSTPEAKFLYTAQQHDKRLEAAALGGWVRAISEVLLQMQQASRHPKLSPMTSFAQRGYIAGVPYQEFVQLMRFFNELDVALLTYISCYAGGYNQEFVRISLEAINPDFLIISRGASDSTVWAEAITVDLHAQLHSDLSLDAFFREGRLFLGDPRLFVLSAQFDENGVRRAQKGEDPIQKMIGHLT